MNEVLNLISFVALPLFAVNSFKKFFGDEKSCR